MEWQGMGHTQAYVIYGQSIMEKEAEKDCSGGLALIQEDWSLQPRLHMEAQQDLRPVFFTLWVVTPMWVAAAFQSLCKR